MYRIDTRDKAFLMPYYKKKCVERQNCLSIFAIYRLIKIYMKEFNLFFINNIPQMLQKLKIFISADILYYYVDILRYR